MNSRMNQVISFTLILGIMLFFFYNSTFVSPPLQQALSSAKSLQQYEIQLHRDLLKYRSGKFNQYDTINTSLNRVRQASVSLARSSVPDNASEIKRKIDQISQLVAKQSELVEDFKTYISVAHNSLLYFYKFSNEFYDSPLSAEDNNLKFNMGKLNTLILAYTNNPTHERALEIYPVIDLLNNNPDFELKTLINHSLMIVEKFPEIDALIEQFNALDIENLVAVLLDNIKRKQASHLDDARIFNVLLFICSIYLFIYVGYLFTRLQRSRNILKQSNDKLNNEISVRRQTESALTALVQEYENENDTIHALIKSVKRALGASCVYISKINHDGTAEMTGIVDDINIRNRQYALGNSPCTDVINNGRAFYNEGFSKYFPEWDSLEIIDAESYLGVAIKDDNGQPVGVLATIDDEPISNILLFENILNIAANKAKIEMARCESVEKSNRYQQGILAIENWSAEALLSIKSDYDLHLKACEVARKITRCSLAAFPVIDHDHKYYTFAAATGTDASRMANCTLPISDGGLCAIAMLDNTQVNIDDVTCDLRAQKLLANDFDFSSAFVTPINFNNRTYGALSLFKSTGAFDEIDKRLIGQLSKSIEILFTNKSLLQDLASEKERAEVTLFSIGDAVITTNINGEIEYMNHIAETLTGWKLEETRGKPVQTVFRILDTDTREPMYKLVDICLSEGIQVKKSMTTLISRNNNEKEIESSMSPITGKDNKIQGIVIVFHDETERRHMENIIKHQATHDSLTGLTNRNEFDRLLSEHIYDAGNHQNREHILCYLDLDRFKLVNDTSGHAAGDELLKQITRVLQNCLRGGDVIGRLGGDEFGIILENCNLKSGEQIAKKIIEEISSFQFKWDDNTFTIGVSIGMVSITADTNSSVEVMKQADVACYTAKDSGRNRVYIYQHEDAELIKRHEEMHWASRISNALDDERFILYAQQICPLQKQDTMQHLEILVRMRDTDGKLVEPGAFIPAAERYNLMVNVDKYIINKVFEHISNNSEHSHSYSINLSGNSLNDENISNYIKSRLREHDIDPALICFEITETAAIANIYKSRKLMFELREMGCRFSLDDFGSGLSSFEYLKNLPVDYLKIDGSFVRDMADNKTDHAMVAAINEIGHVMGISTIAEFVENDRIIHKLRQIGVDYVQGYAVHRPSPLEAITDTDLAKLNQSVAGYV